MAQKTGGTHDKPRDENKHLGPSAHRCMRGLLPPALPGPSGTLSLATLLPAATALVVNKKLAPPLTSLALDSKFWKKTFIFCREAICPLRRGITSLPWAFMVQSEPTFSLWITYLGAYNVLPGTP